MREDDRKRTGNPIPIQFIRIKNGIAKAVNRIEEHLSVSAPPREKDKFQPVTGKDASQHISSSSCSCERKIFNPGEALLFQNHSRPFAGTNPKMSMKRHPEADSEGAVPLLVECLEKGIIYCSAALLPI